MAAHINVVVLLWVLSLSHGITNKDVFNTKTAYDWAVTPPSIADNQDMTISYGGRTCTAIHLNMVARHGYRNPVQSCMEDFTKIRDSLVADMDEASNYFNFLKNWVNRYDTSKGYTLVQRGRDESSGLGRRMAKRFKRLLLNATADIEVMTSSKERTKSSGDAFFSGMTQELLGSSRTDRSPVINDQLIRFYDHCQRYNAEVGDKENPEVTDFQESEYVANVKNGIKTRLGLTNTTFSYDSLKLLYELCAFEMALYGDDGWCGLMSDADRLVIEYGQDLEAFYGRSYGNNISSKLACVLVSNMFQDMDDAIEKDKKGESNKKGTFKFGHWDTQVSLYTALGLAKDSSPLLATNMAAMTDRKFRISHTFPMSASLAFVLYSCTKPETDPDYVIKLFMNEEPAEIPICSSPACMFDVVRSAYFNSINQCQRSEVCRLKATSGDPEICRLSKLLFSMVVFFIASNFERCLDL